VLTSASVHDSQVDSADDHDHRARHASLRADGFGLRCQRNSRPQPRAQPRADHRAAPLRKY
jgi:hypothetical protein